jgi:hypothetical protein
MLRLHSRLTAAAVGAGLALCAVGLAQRVAHWSPEPPGSVSVSATKGSTIALADSQLIIQAEEGQSEPPQAGVARDMPTKPFPTQARAPCQKRFEEEIHGGCWVMLGKLKPPCGNDGYEWKGACYWPSVPPKPPPNAVTP